MNITKRMEPSRVSTQEFEEIYLPDDISHKIKQYIDAGLKELNPYTCDETKVYSFAESMVYELLEHASKGRDPHAEKLIMMIKRANSGDNIPPLFIRNTPFDPLNSLLPAENRTGFNYGGNENDRMKQFFYAEWISWLFAALFNHESVLHPSEHGGNNRFHFITPVSFEDEKLRDTGASTGGGEFYQHSDATVYTELENEEDIQIRLAKFNSSLSVVSERLKRPVAQIVSEMTSRKFTRVDALLLKGILNKSTKTHIGTPKLLQEHLESNGFSKEQMWALSKMPIAHIAGPADGEISGYVGEINQIISVDDNGDILSTCLNGAESRMIYVGSSEEDERLFDTFLGLLRTMPTYHFLLTSSDLLFIPNSSYGKQTNVTHGRGRLTDDEYRIPIGENKFGRRMHCRQYVSSRARDHKASYFGAILQ
ncbi:hypothetical protein [Paenibacillus ihumii]|uniref:hypothetical protein n=1 Tax=Paenibacillus ihumii TaxID=687436 RepID=UPI000A9E26D6|nr:hypothetical protein [Paenibacillus ihumii]